MQSEATGNGRPPARGPRGADVRTAGRSVHRQWRDDCLDGTVDAPGRRADEPQRDGRGPAVSDGRGGGNLARMTVSRMASFCIDLKEVRAHGEFWEGTQRNDCFMRPL